jgi:molybdate transport system regulatory protein
MSKANNDQAQLHLRLEFANGGSLGEADIELIETIARCRSILGTSKLMGLSYRKTWLMTDALNRTFESKVIETFPGRRGAGAEVTAFGQRLAALFRSVERRSAAAAAAALEELTSSLASGPVAQEAAVVGEAYQG